MTSSRSQLPFENLFCTCLRYVRYPRHVRDYARSGQNKWKGPLDFLGWCSVVPSSLLLKQSGFGQEQLKSGEPQAEHTQFDRTAELF